MSQDQAEAALASSQEATSLLADHFDGRSAKAHRVRLSLTGGQLSMHDPQTSALIQQVEARQVQWPERTRHGARIAHLPDGGSLHALDAAAWDRWRLATGQGVSWVVRSQQSWHAVVMALVLLLAAMAAAYQWGLPWAAQAVLSLTPRALDRQVGEAAFDSVQAHWFQPSQLDVQTQQGLQAAFAQAAHQASRHATADEAPPFKVVFRRSKIGPNALTFPDGTIVITDELVTLLDARPDVLIGVFAHEWGHLQHRHSMRLLIQASAVGAIATLLVGDFSNLLAAAPALLGHLAYSRDAEREADDTAMRVLRDNHIPPSVMLTLFEQLGKARARQGDQDIDGDRGPGFAFSSHPSDAERIARFSQP